MFRRIGLGLQLAQQSFGVLRENKRLLVFPLLSGIACLLVFASFAWPLFSLELSAASEGGEIGPVTYVLTFLFYVVSYFVVIFFNAAIVECAIMHFRGQSPTVGDGLRGAASRLPQIFMWALVAATVGMLLRGLEERAGALGRFVVGMMGLAWSAATFFVVPVLVMERLGPIDAAKRSTEIVKSTWAEALSANVGIGLIAAMLYFALSAVVGFGVMQLAQGANGFGGMLVASGILGIIVVALATTAMSAIVTSALYLYAGQGEVPDQFERATLERVFG